MNKDERQNMSKANYVILGILALSVAGNIVQSHRYSELVAQREYIYAGAIEHLKATLKRELTAISAADEVTLVMRPEAVGSADTAGAQ